jgi:hypothetical protein
VATVHRTPTKLGEDCMVVTPSMIPRKSGERQKNDKRDAASRAALRRGGRLTARLPARVACHKLATVDAMSDAVPAIAWKAQIRLCQRNRHMIARGRLKQVAVTAIAPRVGRVCLGDGLHLAGSACKRLCRNDLIGRGLPNCVNRPPPRAASLAAEGNGTPHGTTWTYHGRIGRRQPDGMIVHHHSTDSPNSRIIIRHARRRAGPVRATFDKAPGTRLPPEDRGRPATHHGLAVTNPRITA